MTELKPCPFCGGTNVVYEDGSTFRWIRIECAECGASPGETRVQTLGAGTREEWRANAERDARAQWNTRSPPPAGEARAVAWNVEDDEKNNRVRFTIGVQGFEIAWHPDGEDDEVRRPWMASMLRKALSNLAGHPPAASGVAEVVGALTREERIRIAVELLTEWLNVPEKRADEDRGPGRCLSVALGLVDEVHKEMEREFTSEDGP